MKYFYNKFFIIDETKKVLFMPKIYSDVIQSRWLGKTLNKKEAGPAGLMNNMKELTYFKCLCDVEFLEDYDIYVDKVIEKILQEVKR